MRCQRFLQPVFLAPIAALLLGACSAEPPTAGEPTGETEDADQDTPLSLLHSEPFHMSSARLLGHPFHLAYHALVTVTSSADWEHRLCPIHTYSVRISETGMLPRRLDFKTFPTGGATHSERWLAPIAGEYRLEVLAADDPGCLPLDGSVTITSP